MRELREVYYVDGVRSAFGRAGPKGVFWRTRADDMAVKLVRELLRRNESLPPERIDDVVFAATAQVGDQGLTLGRDVALLAGLPRTVPGFAVDRMCAGALTAITTGAGEIAMGRSGCDPRGRRRAHGSAPDARGRRVQPALRRRAADRPVGRDHGPDGGEPARPVPAADEGDADVYAVRSHHRLAEAWQNGVMRETVVPMSVFTEDGWREADRDEFLRPETSLDAIRDLPTPFRPGGRVTAGNSAGLTDGATGFAARLRARGRGARPRAEAPARLLRVRRRRA
jgi:acetyl-CoA acyltransferase